MEQAEPNRILIVEDSPEMALLIGKLLERKVGAESEMAEDCASAREKLTSATYDVITMDYQLPDGDGLELLREIQAMENPPPVVMVTGHGDEQTAVESFKLGASGYVVKDEQLRVLLPDAVEHTLSEIKLEHAEVTLRESEEQLRIMSWNVSDIIWTTDMNLNLTYTSPSVESQMGYTVEEAMSLTLDQFMTPGSLEHVSKKLAEELAIAGETVSDPPTPVVLEVELSRKDGTAFWAEASFGFLRDADDIPCGVLGISRNITERKRAERLVEVQRDLAVKLSGISDFQETMVVAMEAILEATMFDCGGVYLLDEETGALKSAYSTGLSSSFAKATESYDAGTPSAKLVREGKTLFMNYEDIPVPVDDIRRKEGLGAFGIVPFTDEGKVIGCVNVASHATGEMPEESRVLVETLTGQAIKRARIVTALAESEEVYRTLVETCPDAIFMTDLEGNITKVSQQALELYGCDDVDELLGLNSFELIASEDRERAMSNLLKTLEKGVARNTEYSLLRKSGARFAGEISASLIRGARGEPKAFMAILRDITERKRAEEELRKANVELKGYAHAVSHDLKGPLSAISLAAEVLRDSIKGLKSGSREGTADAEQVIEALEQNVHNAIRRTDDLLALAEVGQLPRGTSDVNVREIVMGVLEERSGETEERGVRIDVGPDLGSIEADHTQIYQLFSNLISNAITHNDSEAPEVHISRLGNDGFRGHRYLVRDNGSGIPESEIDVLFMPFFKKRESSGTGIGLATVEKIVSVYDGEIKAYNDSGACFEFTLRDFHPPSTS